MCVREQQLLAPGIQSISQLSGIAIARGKGAVLEDIDGNRFLDFFAAMGVVSLGHGDRVLAQALSEQAELTSATSFTSAARLRLCEQLADLTERAGFATLRRTQLYSSGAEAVESAIRLARAHTKKFEVLSFWGGFHGKTAGVAGLCGSNFKIGLGPQLPGLHLAPYADCGRCPLGKEIKTCGLACVDFAEEVIAHQTTGQVTAIVVEPIQGTAGNIVPPKGWLRAIGELAHRHGALLIVDEMITGFGRTGTMFAAQGEVVPDILTFGKGVANGYPVSGLITRDDIVADAEPWSRPSFSSSSFGGSPLAAAAASAVVAEIVARKLDEHAASLERTLLDGLHRLAEKYSFVAQVRGRGLLAGFDLEKQGALAQRQACEKLFFACLRRGLLLLAYTPRVRIQPPLCISEAELCEGLLLLDEALDEVAGEFA